MALHFEELTWPVDDPRDLSGPPVGTKIVVYMSGPHVTWAWTVCEHKVMRWYRQRTQHQPAYPAHLDAFCHTNPYPPVILAFWTLPVRKHSQYVWTDQVASFKIQLSFNTNAYLCLHSQTYGISPVLNASKTTLLVDLDTIPPGVHCDLLARLIVRTCLNYIRLCNMQVLIV